MSDYSRMLKAYQNALHLPLSSSSRYVLFSDCHRGTGEANDNFLKNEFLYLSALKYYLPKGFTYIELGDGDELWENRSLKKIKEVHAESFEILSEYYRRKKFYAIYGNHDMVKSSPSFCKKNCDSVYCDNQFQDIPLFPGIVFYPGILLEDTRHQSNIFLTHGHQASLLNSTFWRLSRFLVRYFWCPLETLGVPDPTSAAQNNTQKKSSEKFLTSWAKQQQVLLITGHTHHPMIATEDSPYCNTGSCVSSTAITCIEIQNRHITLVKWTIGTKQGLSLCVLREKLGEYPLPGTT